MKVEVLRFSDLAAAQAHAKQRIDEAAESARTKYITPGSGQAMEYEAAAREAERFIADQPGPYPMLQADVDAGLASDLWAAAQLVLGMRGAWEPVGAEIRRVRLQAKREVDQAATQAQVAQIRDAALSALAQL